MHFIYIIQSLKDKRFYVGCTSDVEKRLAKHNAGVVRSTKSRKPFILLYTEHYPDRYQAFRMERFYKSAKGKREIREKLKHWGIV